MEQSEPQNWQHKKVERLRTEQVELLTSYESFAV